MRFSFVAMTLINMDGFSLHLKQLLKKNKKHYFKKIILKTHLHHSHITYRKAISFVHIHITLPKTLKMTTEGLEPSIF